MIYLIADTDRKYCKIGYSTDPVGRLETMRTGTPLDIEILSVIEGDIPTERKLHRKFESYRIRREWFKYHKLILKEFLDKEQLAIDTKKKTEDEYASIRKGINEQKEKDKVCTIIEWLVYNTTPENGVINLRQKEKEEMIPHLKVGYSTIEKYIALVCKYGVLTKDSRYPKSGSYYVNPSYVWYGDREKRKGQLKFTLEIIQYNNLPDKERQTIEDIKRFEKEYHKQNKV